MERELKKKGKKLPPPKKLTRPKEPNLQEELAKLEEARKDDSKFQYEFVDLGDLHDYESNIQKI